LHAAAVEPRETRQLLVVGEVELVDDQREDLSVLGADPVVGRRR
jgi:hypothetical protein